MANIKEIVAQIKMDYPNPDCELVFKNSYELIVAVILSAQCTDKRVNLVTKELFKAYPTVQDLANADILAVEEIIKPCGFFRNKAKNIIAMARDVVLKHNGEIPSKKDDLKSLAGVGEKTANVVLATAFGVPAIAVDTHVFRVSNRLGLANARTVEKTQEQLEKNLNKSDWARMHFSLVLHGRYVCKAINPKCEDCHLSKNCKFYLQNHKNDAKNA
ncbi:MAG: endonuclease III [Clostridia bacterium]|nr:endonuclease III [Clostridia bacterium]